ncbi:hypothetical protein HMPREF3224_02264 [Anaerococcus hydrogenalis]|nr:hypothetical protein HMPREF3224_02264 [Anaerococcus hydrogenalis]
MQKVSFLFYLHVKFFFTLTQIRLEIDNIALCLERETKGGISET